MMNEETFYKEFKIWLNKSNEMMLQSGEGKLPQALKMAVWRFQIRKYDEEMRKNGKFEFHVEEADKIIKEILDKMCTIKEFSTSEELKEYREGREKSSNEM